MLSLRYYDAHRAVNAMIMTMQLAWAVFIGYYGNSEISNVLTNAVILLPSPGFGYWLLYLLNFFFSFLSVDSFDV